MEQQETLGKRIAALRKNQGWTQEQLGEKVGVSAQAVSKWENDLACPDITTLPLLANLFGVTTDELLGVKQVEPHVVILDKDPEEAKGEFTFHVRRDRNIWQSVCFCVTAILICVTLILRAQTPLFNRPDVATWNYIWPLLVAGLGLAYIRYNAVFGIAALLFGIYEFIWFGWGVPFEIKWYVIVLIFSVAVLIRILLKKLGILPKRPRSEFRSQNQVQEYSDENDFIRTELSFSGNKVVYPRDTLKGMRMETNFGTYVMDLSGVRNFQDAVLDIEVNFGNVILLLPRCARVVRRNAETSFGALRITGDPDPDASQTVYVRGEVNFGNLEIQYPGTES